LYRLTDGGVVVAGLEVPLACNRSSGRKRQADA
jgi:hypothetical protein